MSLQKLKHQGTVISLEADSGDSALLSALARLPSYLTRAKDVFQSHFQNTVQSILHFTKVLDGRVAMLRKVDYATVREIKVQGPTGLKTDLLSYATVLRDAAQALATLPSGMLVPYLSWLNAQLARPERLRSLTGGVAISDYKPIATQSLLKSIDACFVERGREETFRPYGQLIKRSADWDQLNALHREITHLFSPALHREVSNQLNELGISLDTLLTRLTKEPERYTPGAKVLKDLTGTAFEVAEAVELYGMLRHRFMELEHSLDQIAVQIEKVANK
jgi:hypothetical protein